MQNQSGVGKAEALLEALPFIQKFRGQTFVIKYGGSAMEDDHLIERLLRDVVFLEIIIDVCSDQGNVVGMNFAGFFKFVQCFFLLFHLAIQIEFLD